MNNVKDRRKIGLCKNTNLISLVGEYRTFQGWGVVKERILRHPEEIQQKSPSGWMPLQYAFYHHPDYQRDPIPPDLVVKFLDVYPQCAKFAILEACRNPTTITSSLENLLNAVDKNYFNTYAERDFHHLRKGQNLDLQATYLKVAVQKKIDWNGALEYMWIEEVYLYNSTLIDVVQSALRINMEWSGGLETIMRSCMFHLQPDEILIVLQEAIRSEWKCVHGCEYILRTRECFLDNHGAKITLLHLCLNQEVTLDKMEFRSFLETCLDILEQEQNQKILSKLFYYAVTSVHGDLTLIFLLLRNFPCLHLDSEHNVS